jgi:hypothetical protein
MLLCGYVEKHIEACEDDDCALKQKRSKHKSKADVNMD